MSLFVFSRGLFVHVVVDLIVWRCSSALEQLSIF
jgi:hypothetical protein